MLKSVPDGETLVAQAPAANGAATAVDDRRADAARVEQALGALPQVRRARVEAQRTEAGTHRLVAYVVPAEEPAAAPAGPDAAPAASAEQKRVDEWNVIYEWVYGELPQSGALGDNFVGWHSSYTNLPIPLDEMREWRDEAVRRILAHRPRRVLEIGVGTGLLMAHVAPACEQYTATDFSATVIARIAEQLSAQPQLAGKVELLNREANDFSGLVEGHYDLVVINSVVQYFPNAVYLADVLAGALRMVRPGGAVFAGDIRNLRLLPSFRTAVLARGQLPADDPRGALAQVEQSCHDEREMLVDPDFFDAVRLANPQAGALDLRIKRAVHHNELSRHRYDAVLYREPVQAVRLDEAVLLGWGRDVTSLDDLRDFLAESACPVARPETLRVVGVPNRRVGHETAAARLLEDLAPLEIVERRLESAPSGPAGADAAADAQPDPEDFHTMAEGLGYRAVITWASSGLPDQIDVVLTREPGDPDLGPIVPYVASAPADRPMISYGNNPARAAIDGALIAALRTALSEVLPEELMPSVFVTEAP